jgi:hypothetical protein
MANKILDDYQGGSIKINGVCYKFIGETTSSVNTIPSELGGIYDNCLECAVESSSSSEGNLPLSAAAIIAERKPTGSGGTFTQDIWQTRVLNAEVSDIDNVVSISGNVFTIQPGIYLIESEAIAYRVFRHQSRLYDVTNSAVVDIGISCYAADTHQAASTSYIRSVIEITEATQYRIEHRCQGTYVTNGLGLDNSIEVEEQFATVKIINIGN